VTLLADCRMVDLPRILDPRGALSVIEGGRHVPFQIARVDYLYHVPGIAERGGHAERDQEKRCLTGGLAASNLSRAAA
jgi:hypothetical protein